MSDFTHPTHRPLNGSFYRGLLAVCVALIIIIWLWWEVAFIISLLRELPHLEEIPVLAKQIPEILPRRIPSILDPGQVAAATEAIRRSVTRWIPAPGPRPRDEAASGSEGSDSSDDERSYPLARHLPYPPIHSLEAGDARLLVSSSTEQLQQVIRGFGDAKLRWRAVRDAQEAGGFYRFSDVPDNPWILQPGTETFAGHCEFKLTNESTRTWVMKLKITTKLLCLTWQELHEQDWRLCQELKEECFGEVAGQSVEKLLEVALAFSNARWSAGHISQLLTIFEALVDVLHNIGDLPFNRSYQVAGIYTKMVNAFRGILQGTTNDIYSSSESSIHPATDVLIQALEFFCRNRDMVQSILATGDYNADPHSDMFNCWLSKLKEDAERTFQEKGQRYIFILNNMYYVWQMKCHPGGFLSNVVSKLDSLIEQYIKMYLDEYWIPPVLSYLDGESLKNPRRSHLDKFTEEFFSIYYQQRTWKVRTGLKKILREKIGKLVVPKYRKFFDSLQANPSSGRRSILKRVMQGTRNQKQEYTAEYVAEVIRELFER